MRHHALSPRTPTDESVDDLVELCTSAFVDDSLTAWVHPDRRQRAATLQVMFGQALGDAIRSKEVLTIIETAAGTALGVAFWQAGEHRPGSEIIGTDPLSVRLRAVHQATVAHRPAEPHVYLASMAVRPEYRNLGVGRALLTAVIDRASPGFGLIYLEASSVDNRRFYARHGFRERGRALAIDEGALVLHPMEYRRDTPDHAHPA